MDSKALACRNTGLYLFADDVTQESTAESTTLRNYD